MDAQNQLSDRSWIVTFLLCLVGFSGLHRLYSGHVFLAFIYSITGGLLFLGVIFDLISLLVGDYRDVSGKKLN
jgi:TM2 domain-containing membrane protein YozV